MLSLSERNPTGRGLGEDVGQGRNGWLLWGLSTDSEDISEGRTLHG